MCLCLLSIYGFVLLYSAAGGSLGPWAEKQINAFCIFMPISLLIALIDLRIIYQLSYFLADCTAPFGVGIRTDGVFDADGTTANNDEDNTGCRVND